MGLLLVAATLPVQAEPAVAVRDSGKLEDCTEAGKDGPIPEYECVDRNIERKQRLMADALRKARRFLEARERTVTWMKDDRRKPVYLDRSQAAWDKFVEQNCTVIAGASGGSNAWVTRFELDCYSDELDRRIKFLDQLAAGDFSD
jgi:uncharacterized protein YecT (DUF1311 family)